MPSTTDHRAEGQDTWAASHAFWWLLLAGSLAGALGEATLILGARIALHRYTLFNPQGIWMAPLANLLLLVVPLGLVALVARRWGTRAAVVTTAFAAVLAAAIEPLLVVRDRVHPLALLALALGVATQVARFARARPGAFARITRTATVGMLAISVASGISYNTVRAWRERQALAGLGAAPDGAPNVILLVLDTVRALSLSAYGYGRETSPFLAELAARGVRFGRAISPAPWTLPSHASMFTGRYSSQQTGNWTTPLDGAHATLASVFASYGYATGGFVANLRYCGREYGLGRGFQTYRDFAMVQSQIVGSTMAGRRLLGLYNDLAGKYVLAGRKDAARVVDEFLDWQEERGSRPYFAFLNFFDAHEPYAPDAPYDLAFLSSEPPTRALMVGESHDPAEVEGLRGAYDGAIASLDAQLGRLFDELARRGSLDRTIVVVTSDHGEEFAEHGYMSHGNGLNFPALHVPLLIRWPKGGVPAGAVVETPVSLADLAATLIDLTASAERSVLPGASLAPLWRGEAVPNLSPVLSELYWVRNQPDFYPVSRGNMRSLVRGRFHYIAGPEQREELYDIVADPFERIDLLADPAVADTLSALRRAMAAFPAEDRQGR